MAGAALLSAASAAADEWETVLTGHVTVKMRARPGTAVKEVWAEGELAAPVQDIQSVLMEPDKFPSFMPYVKESRVLKDKAPDGAQYVYTRLDLPMVQSRDYVLKVYLDEGVKPDGSGAFRNRWVAVTDKLPERHNVVRLKLNEGSWYVTPKGDGTKSHAVYRFVVDPGGWVPSWAADQGNKSGVPDTFRAIEKEAQRRYKERKAHAGK